MAISKPLLFFNSILLLGVLLIGYGSFYAHNLMFSLKAPFNAQIVKCNQNSIYHYITNPNCDDWKDVDLSRYFFKKEDPSLLYIQNITFLTADPLEPTLRLKGQAILHANESTLPTVVIVHGFRSCAFHYSVLLAANILFKQKFNIFIFDMRNHGYSDSDSHILATYGSNEQYDLKAAMEVVLGLRSFEIENVELQFAEQRAKITKWTSHFVDQESIGMYAISMGGGTSLTFVGHQLLHDPTLMKYKKNVKALFLDSSVCDIYQLLQSNIAQVIYSRTVAQYFMKSICLLSQWVKSSDDHSHACAPFLYHPLNSLEKVLEAQSENSHMAIHFDHSVDDILVELEHTMPCVELAKEAKFDVSTYFVSTKTPQHHLRSQFKCKNHVVQSLFDLKGYEERVTKFFVNHLVNKK